MSKNRADPRHMRARRENAMERPELRIEKPQPIDQRQVEEAIKAGRYVKLPASRRRRL